MGDVQVRRVGTQVVVRLSGDVDDDHAELLAEALQEVATLATSRVCVDLDDVSSVEGAGLEFIVELHRRWRVRLLNTPAPLRGRIPLRAVS